ncbi:methionine--tRNA ligase subunit beta [Candidatus Beckwithbacteria bacterium RBG_13_42_9]|uniref:Methionine--tRNA ligase n=1 Tax=Candidatus Beckwithbacteria bacterium RBG_13_42_9 TaxID=1797457 RepID=A0A1F5E3K3_9BACT|nr:MAG: methionine--tRNA ligase subunit beta [Candidatus Beckwithbacteria bacterium RBG_13_42_9]
MMKPIITYQDFAKLDLRVAKIIKAEVVEGADKLIKITLDVGDLGERVIAAGIREWYEPEDLVGKLIVYLANLEPKMIRGVESQGMLVAAGAKEAVILNPDREVMPGEIIK